ncbi:type 4a pilus biogenesis protein PilO [Candidatus Saccharibacteria bacterium]|nr:type 4a pilus biogenesis protein PilO [Candidatus Saccharibacteria bacterium]
MTPRLLNKVLKITLVVLIVSSVGVLYLGDKQVVRVANETARLKAQVDVNEKQLSTYKKTKVKVDSLGYVNDIANKVLPAEKEQSAIVAEVSQFALRSSLGIEQIAFVEVPKTASGTSKSKSKIAIPKGVEVVPITVQFKPGSKYQNILDFLESVENNRRKMQVTNINLKPDPTNGQLLNQVTVSMNLYAKQAEVAKVKQ